MFFNLPTLLTWARIVAIPLIVGVFYIKAIPEPTQAMDTIELAMDAVRRAAPFGDVSRLPKPWKFTETFLFNDARKFKPRTLDN